MSRSESADTRIYWTVAALAAAAVASFIFYHRASPPLPTPHPEMPAPAPKALPTFSGDISMPEPPPPKKRRPAQTGRKRNTAPPSPLKD